MSKQKKKNTNKNKHSGFVKSGKRTTSQKMADIASRSIGSWTYIFFQTLFISIWVILNIVGWCRGWDAYPFIFLNLMLSIVATYSAPVILMSQNREAERDRLRAINDLATDRRAERRIIKMQKMLDRLERKFDAANRK